MRPELFRIPLPDWAWLPVDSLPIRGYGAMLAAGFLLAILLGAWRARRQSENPDHIYNMGLLALVGGILGARLLDVMAHADQYPDWTRGFNIFEGLKLSWLIGGAAVGVVLTILGLTPGAQARRRSRWLVMGAWATLLGLVLGRAGHIIAVRAAELDKGLPEELLSYNGFLDSLKITSGGLAVFGGLIVATALVVPYLAYIRYRWGVNPLKMADITAPSLALGVAFGRMGCFMNGCCFGAPSNLPWCFSWPAGSIPYEHYSRLDFAAMPTIHPAQLYGVVNALGIFLLLHLAFRWKRRHGVILGAFFGLYAVSRFLLEMIRAGEPGSQVTGLTVWQNVALVVAAAAGISLLLLRKVPMSDLLWSPPLKNSRGNRRKRSY